MQLKIGTTLPRLMKERRLSVKELSRLSSVPVSTLHEWTNGRTPRDPVQAKKVADVLQVSLNRLLFDEADFQEAVSIQQLFKQDLFSGVFEINIRKVKMKGESND